jgi:hypothetical protein
MTKRKESFSSFEIRILELAAPLSRFRITSGLIDHDPSRKNKVVDFGEIT